MCNPHIFATLVISCMAAILIYVLYESWPFISFIFYIMLDTEGLGIDLNMIGFTVFKP